MTNQKATERAEEPDKVIFDLILGTISSHDEGSDLVDFARRNKIDFRFFWGLSLSEWNAAENKILCDRSLNREDTLGALAHQIRHAFQASFVPHLENVNDERLAKTSLLQQVLLHRLVEGDAFSYELAMRVALMKKGIIRDAAASMAQLPQQLTGSVEDGEELPLVVHPARMELYHYANKFEKEYGGDPFSPEARAEAFLFFQQSMLFRDECDSAFFMRQYMKCSGHMTTQEAFQYAAAKPLPDFQEAAAAISLCGTDANSPRYLTHATLEGLEQFIYRQLSSSMKEMIGINEGTSAKRTAKAPQNPVK